MVLSLFLAPAMSFLDSISEAHRLTLASSGRLAAPLRPGTLGDSTNESVNFSTVPEYPRAEPTEPHGTAISQRVTVEACTGSGRLHCAPTTRWRESEAKTRLRIVAELTNVDSYDSDYFVLSASDFIIAPRFEFTPADFDRLKTGATVSWGQLTTDNDMFAVAVRDLDRQTTRRLIIREFLPADLLRARFSAGDQLWPWLIRFRVLVFSREGTLVSTSSAILELEPTQRTRRE
jgi:hypothetical protein